ncbi:DNA kinase/phosphatase Pnk1 [Tilletia horrida]|nr:DNA kinase/phosphatase Pnk1 [Tilletia horrida]
MKSATSEQSTSSSSSASASTSRRKAVDGDTPASHSDENASKRLKVDTATQDKAEGPSSQMKLAPIFNRIGAAAKASAATPSASSTQLRWLPSFGPQSTCHVGIYGDALPPPTKTKLKAAIFDLDGTLVVPKSGKTHPERSNEYDFKFLFSQHTLKQVQDEHRLHGRTVIIVTNQGYFKPGMGREGGFETWKKKQALIGQALDVPHVVLVATGEDRFRKPAIGMWDAFWSVALNQLHVVKPGSATDAQAETEAGPSSSRPRRLPGGRKPKAPEGAPLPEVRITDIEREHFDAAQSFYVGDAAGRAGDHSDVDRKWAGNVGVAFFTPEQYFTEKKKDPPFKLSGWAPKRESDASSRLPLFSPTNTPLVPATEEERDDLILFVGPPGAGKTEFFKRYLQPFGYEWVNQDTLRTYDACKRAVRTHLEAGKGCVVDNTNRNKKTRKGYIELAQELGRQVRCFYFDIEQQRSFHNNAFRANSGLESGRSMIPPFAIQSYFKERELPTRDEGFSEEPKTISWQFVDTDEETTRRYYMWY